MVNEVQARVNALEHESSFLLTHKPLRLSWGKEWHKQSQRQVARNIRGLIGEAMAIALNSGTLEDCKKILAEAERQIAVVKDQQARPVFAGWFISVVALLAVIAAVFYVGGTSFVAPADLLFVRHRSRRRTAGFFALEAGVLQAAVSSEAGAQRGMRLFLCIAAGASERVLPSLIGRAEGVVNGNKPSSGATAPRTEDAQVTRDKPTFEQPVG